MATVTTFVQPTTALPRVNGIGVATSNVIDIGGYTAADVFDLFTLPATSVVLGASVLVIEDAGETCTFDIGITGGDVDGVLDGIDLNQAAGTVITGTAGDDISSGPVAPNTAAAKYSALAVTGSTYAAGKFQVTIFYACGKVG